MKKFKILLALMMMGYIMQGQNNPNANSYVDSITLGNDMIMVGEATTASLYIGNRGTDPIPAAGVTYSFSFAQITTVDQLSLNLDGGPFSVEWYIDNDDNVDGGPGTTYLFLRSIEPGIPPETEYVVTVDLIGKRVGGPLQNTGNSLHDSDLAQNTDAGDDNANTPIEVLAPLPVEMKSFTVGKEGQDGILRWSTAKEVDNSHFEVERSIDGKRYEKIGRVKGSGTTTQLSEYGYEDRGIGTRVGDTRVYYRLKQVDYDGEYAYSDVRYVRFEGDQEMYVYPNPVTTSFRIGGAVSEEMTMTIYDETGKLMLEERIRQGQEIDVQEWRSGIYKIVITNVDSMEENAMTLIIL